MAVAYKCTHNAYVLAMGVPTVIEITNKVLDQVPIQPARSGSSAGAIVTIPMQLYSIYSRFGYR